MTKAEMACYIMEALRGVDKWTNLDHGEYKGLLKHKKDWLIELYDCARKVKVSDGSEPREYRNFNLSMIVVEYHQHPMSKHLRLGQWFCEQYVSGPFPELFYEPNDDKALELIAQIHEAIQ